MRDTELKRMRDRDLYSVYVEGIRNHTFSGLGDAADYARTHSAKQYYIEARTASLLVGRIMAGYSLVYLNTNSVRRIWDIYRKYLEYIEKHGHDMRRERIIESIVESEAPEFYLSRKSVEHIIQRERKNARRRSYGE